MSKVFISPAINSDFDAFMKTPGTKDLTSMVQWISENLWITDIFDEDCVWAEVQCGLPEKYGYVLIKAEN